MVQPDCFVPMFWLMSGQKVTVIERGQEIEKREKAVQDLLEYGLLHSESNIAFGEGGAGTFSDGKLTTGVKNKRIRYILETFVKVWSTRGYFISA